MTWFRIARLLGVHPDEAMRLTTHRQFLAWEWWFEHEAELPDATQLYLMQVSQCVRQVLSKTPAKIKLKDFRLSRKRKRKPTANEIRQMQQVWIGRTGLPPKGKPK